MEKEVKAVDKVLNDINVRSCYHGRFKFFQIEIIENLLNKVDNLIITGGMTYTFTKAQGGKIGLSICEDDKLDLALELLKKAKEKGVNLVLARCQDCRLFLQRRQHSVLPQSKRNTWRLGRSGYRSWKRQKRFFAEVIKNSKTILWNGPTGVFEFDNFTHGSRSVGEAIVENNQNGAFSLVGGGDSVNVNKFGLANGVSYVSTGGGALLEAIGKSSSGYRCYQRIKEPHSYKRQLFEKRVAFLIIYPTHETEFYYPVFFSSPYIH